MFVLLGGEAGSLLADLFGNGPKSAPNFLWLPEFSVGPSLGFSATDLRKRPTFFGVLDLFSLPHRGYRPSAEFLTYYSGLSA
jgi:hypothetical protein